MKQKDHRKSNLKKSIVILLGLLIGNMVLLLCCLCMFAIMIGTRYSSFESMVPKDENQEPIEQEIPIVTIQDGVMLEEGCLEWLSFVERSKNNQPCEIQVNQENTTIVVKYEKGRYAIEKNDSYNVIVDNTVQVRPVKTRSEYLHLTLDYSANKVYSYIFSNEEQITLEKIYEDSHIITPTRESGFSEPEEIGITIKNYINQFDTIQGIINDQTNQNTQYISIGADYEIFSFSMNVPTELRRKIALEEVFLEKDAYLPSQAKQEYCLVIEDGVVTGGANVWNCFWLQSQNGKNAEICVIHYEQGFATEVMELSYNRNKALYEVVYVKEDDTIQCEQYQYLRLFDNSYVLTNKESLTEEDWREDFKDNQMPGGVRTVFEIHVNR